MNVEPDVKPPPLGDTRRALSIGPILILLILISTLLPILIAFDDYQWGKTGEPSLPLLSSRLSLLVSYALCIVAGLWRIVQFLLRRQFGAGAYVLFLLLVASSSVHTFFIPILPLLPSMGGESMLRRGVIERVLGSATMETIKEWARPFCVSASNPQSDGSTMSAINDRSRWPAWLVKVNPDKVFVRPMCSTPSGTLTCWAVQLEWGGSMIGHWGIAILPDPADHPTGFEVSSAVAPGIYWLSGP